MPYTGVKTSILILDKSTGEEGKTDIVFFKVSTIGFSLGSSGHEIEKNDLPRSSCEDYLRLLRRTGELSRCSWLGIT